MTTPIPAPKLAPPGAGLPFFEALIVRLVYPPIFSRSSWDESLQRFDQEGRRILEAVRGQNDEKLARPVLIKRIRGIEDSSRHWSAAMTMEHLMIVGNRMAFVIKALSHGRTLPGKVDTASVKPKGESNAGIVKAYEHFLDEFKTR